MDNGLVLYVLSDHELPLIHLTLAVRAGSMYEPQGKEGLAELTAKVMREGGTAGMSGDVLNETLSFMAAGIEPSTGKESVTWKMDVMKKDLPEAMDLLIQILRDPRFDEGKLALLRDLALEDLRRIADALNDWPFENLTAACMQGRPVAAFPHDNPSKV
jgi:zinc protease